MTLQMATMHELMRWDKECFTSWVSEWDWRWQGFCVFLSVFTGRLICGFVGFKWVSALLHRGQNPHVQAVLAIHEGKKFHEAEA